MKLPHWFFSFTLLICAVSFGQNEKQYKVTTIAFYNVENLFDYEDDPLIFDDHPAWAGPRHSRDPR